MTQVMTTIDALLPDVVVGDEFTIGASSRVGRLRLRGDATIEQRDAESATIALTCRVFGVRSTGRMEIGLTERGAVSIEVHGIPLLALRVEGMAQVADPELLVLDIDPGDELRITADEEHVEIVASGLPLGEIRLALTPSA